MLLDYLFGGALVCIRWVDVTAYPGWLDAARVAEATDEPCVTFETYGRVLSVTKDWILMASSVEYTEEEDSESIDYNLESVGDVHKIPLSLVRSVFVLSNPEMLKEQTTDGV